jgi:hypothetical protein
LRRAGCSSSMIIPPGAEYRWCYWPAKPVSAAKRDISGTGGPRHTPNPIRPPVQNHMVPIRVEYLDGLAAPIILGFLYHPNALPLQTELGCFFVVQLQRCRLAGAGVARLPLARQRSCVKTSSARVPKFFSPRKRSLNLLFVVVRPIAVRDRSNLARWISGCFGVVRFLGVRAAQRRWAGHVIRVFTRTAECNSHRERPGA